MSTQASRSASLDLKKLNEPQREAVLHGEGPLLVLAGAGSGKTSTMTYRIAHLVAERKVSGSSILGLSFTNKAAEELRERVTDLVSKVSGKKAAQGLTISTFHSLASKLLRADADKLGFQKNFSIVDQNDQRDLARQILRNIKIDERKFEVERLIFEIGQAKNRFLSAEQAEQYFMDSGRMPQDYALAAASVYPRYQEQLRVLNSMDFDDLLFYSVKLLEDHADVREKYNRKFKYVLVDEYQDTNPAQFKLIRLLTERQQNICVVGDDDQSIYAWRGADPSHILEFGHQFPKARTITLAQNYRSTMTILKAANEVIKNNRLRHPKELWSQKGDGEPLFEYILEQDRDESDFVADEILKLALGDGAVSGDPNSGQKRQVLRPWKDFAILYRSNAQSRLFEEALRMRRVPYKIVGGMSFLDRKEVKDLLCYWRLLINPRDDASLRRVINVPARGVGRTALEALSAQAFKNEQALSDVLGMAQELAPRAVTGIGAFRAALAEMRDRLKSTPPEAAAMAAWGRWSLERMELKKAIEEDTEDPLQRERRWDTAEELVHALGQFSLDEDFTGSKADSTAFLREFIARLTLDAQEEEEDEEEKSTEPKNEVTLLTLHGAKGLEYPVVFLVGLEDGYLPHQRTIEEKADLSEERRLCYVGITRAKDRLILTRTRNRIRYGKPVPRYPSRFLKEIPSDLIVSRNLSAGPESDSEAAVAKHEEKVKSFLADIKAQLQKK